MGFCCGWLDCGSTRNNGYHIMAKKVNKSVAPDLFLKMLQANFKGLDIVKEYKFHPRRRWRFDYAFPFLMVAVEVDGGVWTGGRHINPAGYINDMEKLNTAASMGWLVLRITTDDRFASKTYDLIKNAIEYRINES
jgi:very-short-patch-repair endonuclease